MPLNSSRIQHTVRKIAGKRNQELSRDASLVSRLRKRAFPSPRQFFQISSVLSVKEKVAFWLALVLFISSLGFVGFTLASSNRVTVPKIAGEYREGVIGSPQLINPLYAILNEADQDLVSLVYSGLLRYDAKHGLVPDMAVKYDVSEDKKTYTFQLKENIVWHDGEPFTSSDVVYTFDLIQDPEVGSPLLVSFQNVEVTAIDKYTVSFVLSEPFSSFASSLANVGILPQHIWSDIPGNQIRLAQRNLQPIGTGPFKFKRLIKNQAGFIERVELERFADFYRNPPYLKELVLQFFGEYDGPQGLVSALREGKIDGISFVPYEYRERVERKHIVLHTLELPQYTALFFNQKNEILKDKAVRHALLGAIDKDRIVADVLQNEATVISGPILPGFPGYEESRTSTPFSLEVANTALDKLYDRIPEDEYRALLVEDRVAVRIKAEAALAPSSTTSGTNGETESTSETSTTSTPATVDAERIRTEVVSELELELDPSQLFYRYKKGGSKKDALGFELVTAGTPEYAKIAEIIAGSLQEVGFKVTVRFVDARDIGREVLRPRSYDMLLYGMIIGSDPDQYPFWHSSQINYPGLNLSGYSNKAVDETLVKIRATDNPEEVTKLYTEFATAITTDAPAAFLYTPTYTYALSDFVDGFGVDRIGKPSDRFSNVTDWYTDEKKIWKQKD